MSLSPPSYIPHALDVHSHMSQMWTNAQMVLTAAVKMPSAPTWTVATHAHVIQATLVTMEKVAQVSTVTHVTIEKGACILYQSILVFMSIDFLQYDSLLLCQN